MKKRLYIYLIVLSGAALTLFFYWKVTFHPNDYFFSDHGDALKNYFTSAWRVANDSSCTNSMCMNYPYGENFLYTDCQPALSGTLRMLSGWCPGIADHTVGILNFLMILSIFLTFIITYFLLLELDIGRWTSFCFSLGMTMLAPQLFRLSGHFALSYSMAVPLTWFLVIRVMKTPGRVLPVSLLFLNGLFWMFIHAYLGMIVIAFATLIILLDFLFGEQGGHAGKKLTGILAAVFPVILYYITLKLTDHHAGRTTNPSGFFLYNAEPDDIFIPNHGFMRNLLERATGNGINQEWEAWGYVGISATIILLIALVAFFVRLSSRSKPGWTQIFTSGRPLRFSMFAAIILLLFAMGMPFKQLPGLLEHMPVFKQFRATGRFDWPFYFVSMAYAASVLQSLHSGSFTKQGKFIATGLIITATLLNLAEAWPGHQEISRSIEKAPNSFNRALLSKEYSNALDHINKEKYQAIISIPFYYYGSESFSRPRDEAAVFNSIVLSYHSGLPLVNANLTRTSIEESKKIIQVVSPDYYAKPILKDLLSEKAFLLAVTGSSRTQHEQDLVNKSIPVYQSARLSLYSLTIDSLGHSSGRSLFESFLKEKPYLDSIAGFYVTDASSLIRFDPFEAHPSDTSFSGKGAFHAAKQRNCTLAEFKPGTFSASVEYSVSAWFYNGYQDALNGYFRFIIEEQDATGKVVNSLVNFPEEAETIDGDWSLLECSFRVINPADRIFILTKGGKRDLNVFYADDLLVMEKGAFVFRYNATDRILFYNNQRINLHE